MLTRSHVRVGVATMLAVAVVHPLGYVDLAAALVTATLTAGGPLSPDIDNQPFWRTLDRWLPDEWLGNGGPLQHRGILHSWMIPLTLWIVWHQTLGALRPVESAILLGVTVGWGSHLVADLIVGGRVYGGDGPGIPLILWWGHAGLGFVCGGVVERLVRVVLAPAAAAWAILVLTGTWTPLTRLVSG